MALPVRLVRSSIPTMMSSRGLLFRPKRLPGSLRNLTSSPIRRNTTTQESKPPSAHRAPYKNFGGAFIKVFMGAVFTYQLIYYAWTRLEVEELKYEKSGQLSELEKKALELSTSKGS
ncbi:hypothetical protein AJ80_04469 [Polytolypa hystricis UAMH7299]|uniref:Uncharacterized protein n=1 Tax=Polytolypa hystricis (strain UAMH7299) TaxID=1447883 RepID=A0A2B7YBN0_POLH7|nr:hypothetical protein AJ80_04469 [Polytolypa hystricis UAMH7299]